jgi:RHS repeat-associated protein
MNGSPDTRPVKGINSVKLTYDKEGRYSEVENGIGGVERYFGDAFGRVIKHVSAAGAVTERSFDAASGQVAERTDSNNHRHTILKDELGAPMGFERPDGSGTKVRVKEPYTVERVTTHTGAVVEIRYNEYGEIVHYRHPDGTFEAMEYDARGLLALSVDRAGGTTRYVRDAMGNPIEVQHPHGGSEHIRYDYLGRPIEYRSPAGEVTQWAYDARSEIVFKRLHDGTEIHIERDANRKPVTIRLGQRVRRFEYGGLGWVTRIIEPDGAATEYRYDVEGNLTLVRNPRGQEFRCQFDQARRLIACKSFEDVERSGSYDVAGLLTSLTRPLGADARTYDHEQRLIAADTPDGSVTLEYMPSGGVTKIDNGIAPLEHAYNSMRELVKDQQADHTSELEWGSGWLRSVTSDVGVPVRYAYTGGILSRIDAGRLALHLHYPNPDDILIYLGDALVHRRHHDKLGFLRWAVWARYDERQGKTDDEVALPNAPDQLLLLQYDYNEQGELIREQRSDGRVVAYEHDACGRIVKKRVWRNSQLISEETPRYDAAGSPLLADVQHDALMRPARYANETFEYDDAGRLVRRSTDAGEWTYEWDFDDNLLKVVAPHHTVEMDYDGRGRRMRKRVLVDDNVVRRASYVWSNQTLLHEVDETAGVTRTYLRHNADWVAFGHVDKAGDTESTCFYLADGSGMPDLAFDEQGNVVWSAERSVFGVVEADPASGVDVRVRFANQLYDADVGLVYNRMRWYDPRTGSYATPDPILLRGGLNHRDYVSNPTLYIDPMGHAPTPTNNTPFGQPPAGHNRPPHPGNADGMTHEYMRNPGHFATEGTQDTPGYVSIEDDRLLNAAGSGLDPVREDIDAAGAAYGCHTCGSKNPRGPDYPQGGQALEDDQANTHFVPDHIPPATLHTPRRGDALIEDIPAGGVRLYPQCRRCSSTQGGQLGALTRSSTPDERGALGQAGINLNLGQ